MRKLKPSFEDLLRSSLRSVLKNKSRTILTSLGVIIGVTSVILLTSIGTGLKKYINYQFETLGSNTLFVAPGRIFKEDGGFNQNSSSMMMVSFKPKDVANIKKTLKDVMILPEKSFSAEVKSKDYKKSTTIVGSNYLYGPHGDALPSDGNGRWFTKEEDEKNALVAVLGQKIAKDLFPNTTALGKKFTIKGKRLKVIGIEDARGSSMGGPSLDEYVFIPIGLANDFAGNENIQELMVKTSTKDQVENTKKTIEKILLEDYDQDSFSVFDSTQLLTSINSIISTLTVALTGIAPSR